MSKYGEKFEKALERVLKIKFRVRLIAIIICLAILALDLILTFSLMFIENDEGSAIINDLIGGTEALSVALSYVLGFLMLIGIFFPIGIILYCLLNKIRAKSIFNKVMNRTCSIAYYLDGKEASESLKKEFKIRLKAKDRDWIIKTTDAYYDKCEELKKKYEMSPNESENERSGKDGFDGWLLQEIGWFLLGFLVTIITIGICFPVAYCWMLRWNYKHTLYDGKRLTFDGKASQLIGKWVCWLLLCVPTIGIFALFIPKKLMNWKVSHLHLAGEQPYLGGIFKANPIVYVLVMLGCSLLNLLTLTLLKPIFVTWKNRYIQNRLVIDGRRMEFDGNGIQLLGKYILWSLLKIITIGIYGFFVHIRMKKWISKHTHMKPGYAQIKVI